MQAAFVKLEDNRECILLDEFQHKNEKYTLLVNAVDKNDFIVRKVVNEELVGLENEDELKEVFESYMKYKVQINDSR